ncbi:unnamed protein product [Paramecium primaurelia]|uniref:Nuclear cap-binding protein subunit 2 n=1 Tax=Paramecium primaurelia TaxID=5886 RepID=A0A8S1QH17_PARPR|nr:unnamed protein product [Paramecium primaurelia]
MSNLNAASLYENLQQPISQYYDKSSNLTREEYFYKLSISTTLYLGNLSIYTTEEQIFELFNRVGAGVRRLIMGRNKETGKAIGFCFIEYFNHEDAKEAHEYLDLLKLDERAIRVDWDIGYSEGREYGRGTGGNQVRDSYRKVADPERPNVQSNRGRGRSYNNNGGRRKQADDDESDNSGGGYKKRGGNRSNNNY